MIAGLAVAGLAVVGVVVFFLTRDDDSSAEPGPTSVGVTLDDTVTTGTPETTIGLTTTPSSETTEAPEITEAPETTDEPDPTNGPDPTVDGDIPPPEDEPDGLGDDQALDELAQDCYDGEMQACDDLFFASPDDSEYKAYGDSCAGRQPEGTSNLCVDAFPE